jgi:hypothetical protein
MQRAEPLRVADRVTAEALVAGVLGNMAALESVLADEAAHVRAGRLRESIVAAEPKAALAAAYMQGLEVAKANAVALKRFHPDGVEMLRAAHRRFTAAVEANQTVLASAKTVSEGLIKSSRRRSDARRCRRATAARLRHRPRTAAACAAARWSCRGVSRPRFSGGRCRSARRSAPRRDPYRPGCRWRAGLRRPELPQPRDRRACPARR